MAHIVTDDFRTTYPEILYGLLYEGRKVAPRGMPTHELPDVTIEVTDVDRVLPIGVGRGLDLGIAAVEAIQLCGGFSDYELVRRVAPQLIRFGDQGFFWGAYGPRVRHQLARVVELLERDPDTRRACVQVWDQRDLFVEDALDIPCTAFLQFMVREEHLELHTTMRSNDAWLGLPYDVFQFTQLQHTVAGALKLPTGTYFHHATSLHLYDRDVVKLDSLKVNESAEPPEITGFYIGGYWSIERLMERARMLAHGAVPPTSETEKWYARHLQATL